MSVNVFAQLAAAGVSLPYGAVINYNYSATASVYVNDGGLTTFNTYDTSDMTDRRPDNYTPNLVVGIVSMPIGSPHSIGVISSDIEGTILATPDGYL